MRHANQREDFTLRVSAGPSPQGMAQEWRCACFRLGFFFDDIRAPWLGDESEIRIGGGEAQVSSGPAGTAVLPREVGRVSFVSAVAHRNNPRAGGLGVTEEDFGEAVDPAQQQVQVLRSAQDDRAQQQVQVLRSAQDDRRSWDARFIHQCGYWSHYDHRSRSSSWPIPVDLTMECRQDPSTSRPRTSRSA